VDNLDNFLWQIFRSKIYQSGLEPDYKGFGDKYVTLQKHKFFSHFLETKHNNGHDVYLMALRRLQRIKDSDKR